MNLVTNIKCRKVDLSDLTDWVGANYLPSVDTLTIAYNDSLLNKLSSDIELLGISTKVQVPHCYNIFLKTSIGQASLPSIICHELYHIYQMERGDLDYNLSSNLYIWKGIKYDNIPYNSRPWEQEAFKNTILKEYKNSR